MDVDPKTDPAWITPLKKGKPSPSSQALSDRKPAAIPSPNRFEALADSSEDMDVCTDSKQKKTSLQTAIEKSSAITAEEEIVFEQDVDLFETWSPVSDFSFPDLSQESALPEAAFPPLPKVPAAAEDNTGSGEEK